MDDENDDLADDVMTKLKRALGDFDGDELRDKVRQGLREAMRAIEAIDDIQEPDTFEDDFTEEPDDSNVVQLGVPNTTADGVSVRVLRGGLDDGSIRVEEAWQTVYTGVHAAPYRITLGRGHMEVTVDDQIVAKLVAGQTTDVEGRSIRVRGSATGRYRRL